jgi:membrane-bound metal-dependent hydrolase YbcI (DUF457 family)
LGGLVVALALAPARGDHDQKLRDLRGLRDDRVLRSYVIWCIAAACLPDIDFAWGRHNMETHSLGFSVMAGIAVYGWRRSTRLALAAALAAGTHVLFDWLGSDDFPPLGVMALWPFSSAFYFAEAYVFPTISRRYWLPGFVAHNVAAVLREVALLLPMVALAAWARVKQ